MSYSSSLRELNKSEIRGAIAFASDALQRATDAMALIPGQTADADYLIRQLEFVRQYAEIALRLAAASRVFVADDPDGMVDLLVVPPES